MAENRFNTTTGTVGALDVIARRCLEGFQFWQRIKDSSVAARDFQADLDMQRVRFDVWVQDWVKQSNDPHRDRLLRVCEPVVKSHLEMIHGIFNSFGSLDTPSPVSGRIRPFAGEAVLPPAHDFGDYSRAYGGDGGSADPPTISSMDGIKWALREDKLKAGLNRLATLINDLHSLLPPLHIDSVRALVLSDALATQDPNELARRSLAENNDPMHAAFARMKSLAYRPYGARFGNEHLRMSCLEPINRDNGDARFMARYQGELVLVEEKYCRASWNHFEQLNILEARIDNIVARLQSPNKPGGLRTLPCRGGAVSKGRFTANDQATWVYNIVYRVDYPRFMTLEELLSRKGKSAENAGREKAQFPLGTRFAVAQMLARALVYLHIADWLHKAIRSENVVFFINHEDNVLSSLPYLVGFEHSRIDAPGEQTESIVEKPNHRFYRHPKAMAVPVADPNQPLGGPGRYRKVYDIYSMGVILIEIGLFITVDSMAEKHFRSEAPSSEEIRNILIKKAIPRLRFAVGDVYADAALACLDGSLDEPTDQPLHHVTAWTAERSGDPLIFLQTNRRLQGPTYLSVDQQEIIRTYLSFYRPIGGYKDLLTFL